MEELTIEELARYYFQNKLSKFCPADKTERPNGFEKQMFNYGYSHNLPKIEELEEKNKQLELQNKKYRKSLEHIAKLGIIFDENASAIVAKNALEEK